MEKRTVHGVGEDLVEFVTKPGFIFSIYFITNDEFYYENKDRCPPLKTNGCDAYTLQTLYSYSNLAIEDNQEELRRLLRWLVVERDFIVRSRSKSHFNCSDVTVEFWNKHLKKLIHVDFGYNAKEFPVVKDYLYFAKEYNTMTVEITLVKDDFEDLRDGWDIPINIETSTDWFYSGRVDIKYTSDDDTPGGAISFNPVDDKWCIYLDDSNLHELSSGEVIRFQDSEMKHRRIEVIIKKGRKANVEIFER